MPPSLGGVSAPPSLGRVRARPRHWEVWGQGEVVGGHEESPVTTEARGKGQSPGGRQMQGTDLNKVYGSPEQKKPEGWDENSPFEM